MLREVLAPLCVLPHATIDLRQLHHEAVFHPKEWLKGDRWKLQNTAIWLRLKMLKRLEITKEHL